ncbi:Mss4-like protein [Xylaria digitata]|nr:Mss4-like protein [Xylaria digitata]
MTVKTASCLCGGIKVEIHGDPFMRNLCHCSSCQKSTGAAFGSLAAYMTDVRITVPLPMQVTYVESEPSLLKTFIDTSPESGDILKRSFCGKCGSPVRVQRGSKPDTLIVPVGIIDGDKTVFKPQAEFFCRGKANWVGDIQDSKTFDANPPKYPPV